MEEVAQEGLGPGLAEIQEEKCATWTGRNIAR